MESVDVFELLTRPEWFLYSVDPQTATGVLCPRVVAEGEEQAYYQVPLQPLISYLDSAPELLRRPLLHIFMSDFCGSTLLAQALDCLPSYTVHNEPLAFPDIARARLAQDHEGVSLMVDWRVCLQLARVKFAHSASSGVVVEKTWPDATGIMSAMIESSPASFFLFGPLEEYLLAVFRQPWRRAFTRRRMQTVLIEARPLARLAGGDFDDLPDASVAAIHWLYQQYNYLALCGRFGRDRLRCGSSRDWYAEPAGFIGELCDFFGWAADPDQIDQAVTRVLARHSKEPDRAFSASLRRAVQAETKARHAEELQQGLQTAADIMRQRPLPATLPGQICRGDERCPGPSVHAESMRTESVP